MLFHQLQELNHFEHYPQVYVKEKLINRELLAYGTKELTQHLDNKDFFQDLSSRKLKNDDVLITLQKFAPEEKHFPNIIFCPKYFIQKSFINPLHFSCNYALDVDSAIHHYSSPSYEEWEKSVQEILNEINSPESDLSKVVLCKKSTWKFSSSINAKKVFAQVFKQHFGFPHYFVFVALSPQEAYISLSPETLFKLNNKNLLTIDAIAGTRSRAQSPLKDWELEQELLFDLKEKHEHEIVVNSIQEKINILYPFPQLKWDFSFVIKKLKKVQHRYNKLMTKIPGNYTLLTVSQILQALHPTAALGGHPKESALEQIKKHEKFERGLYGPPIGILTAKESFFIVSIRLMHIMEQELTCFAGAGIVKGSVSLNEWKEVDKKINSVVSIQ